MEEKPTQSRERGQGGTSSRFISPCGVQRRRPCWGLGQRPNCFTGDQYVQRAQQRRRQRSVPASNFAHPQMRPPSCSFHQLNIVAPDGRDRPAWEKVFSRCWSFSLQGKNGERILPQQKTPAAIGQIVRICCRGCAMLLENALTPARTASCTARRRSRLFAAAPRACRIR